MGRSQLQPGEMGEVGVTPLRLDGGKYVTLPSRSGATHYRARVYFCDWSGKRRELSRTAERKPHAIANVEQAVRDALADSDAALTGQTLLVDACRAWLDDTERDGSKLSARTLRDYRGAFDRTIAAAGSPVLGLSVAQANNVQTLTRFLRWSATERGRGTTVHAKMVLSGTLSRALTYGVIDANALRQVVGGIPSVAKRWPRPERDSERAMTVAERDAVLAAAEARATGEGVIARSAAKRRAGADLASFMVASGVRVGEALALRWEHVDLFTGRCEVRGTKTAGSDRLLTLPDWMVRKLRDRANAQGHADGLVFAAPAAGDPERAWDQSNASGELRKILDAAGLQWATPHTFRKSVATRLANSGVPIQRVADVLGHKDPSMTARVYLGRDFLGDKADLAGLL